jgi:hypothetical protein
LRKEQERKEPKDGNDSDSGRPDFCPRRPAKNPESRSHMTKEDLVDLLKKILNTETELDFLFALEQRELETLIACIRNRIEQEKRKANSSKIN